MRFLLPFFLLSLFFTGCAGSIYDSFPRQYPETHTVNITVSRSVEGVLIAKDIIFDGSPIAEIGKGEYLTFRVSPGTHSIGIPESLLAIDYKAGKDYYLHIVPTRSWNEPYLRTELMDEKRARSLLSEYADITPVAP